MTALNPLLDQFDEATDKDLDTYIRKALGYMFRGSLGGVSKFENVDLTKLGMSDVANLYSMFGKMYSGEGQKYESYRDMSNLLKTLKRKLIAKGEKLVEENPGATSYKGNYLIYDCE